MLASLQATVTAYADLESLRSSPNHLPSRILKWFSDQDSFSSSSSSSGGAQLPSSTLSPSRVLTSLETAASAVRTAAAQLAEDEEGGGEEEEEDEQDDERKRRRIERHPIHVKTLQFASCPQVTLSGGADEEEEKKKKTGKKDEGSRARLHVWTDAPYVLSIASLVCLLGEEVKRKRRRGAR